VDLPLKFSYKAGHVFSDYDYEYKHEHEYNYECEYEFEYEYECAVQLFLLNSMWNAFSPIICMNSKII